MKNNPIKNSFNKINLSDSAKQRIVENCNNNLESKRSIAQIPLKYVAVATVLLIVSVVSALSVGAATGIIKYKPIYPNKPHISEENLYSETNETQNTVNSIVKEGYILSCNGIAGDTERVYFDLTLRREDDAPITKLGEDEFIYRFDPLDSHLEFEDGHKMEVFFLMLEDSTEYVLHFEASSLFLNKDKPYLGQKAKLFIGSVQIQTSSPISHGIKTNTVCKFNESVEVDILINDTVRMVEFEKGEFEILDGGISLHRGELSATKVYFYGECFIEGPIYDLQTVIEKAYLICDGKHIPCGGKLDAGTLDGDFVIGWISETVIDPDKITAICIEGKTINID